MMKRRLEYMGIHDEGLIGEADNLIVLSERIKNKVIKNSLRFERCSVESVIELLDFVEDKEKSFF